MLVMTEASKVEYVAAEGQTAFAVPFAHVPGDLDVFINDIATTAYVITGTLTEGFFSTATLTFTEALLADDEVLIRRETARTQQTDYVDHDPFSAASHENALSKLTMIAQDLYEITTRCLQLNVALSYGKTGLELPSPDGVTLSDPASRLAIVWNQLQTNLELLEVRPTSTVVGSTVLRSTTAALPPPGSPGTLRDVTDGIGGLHVDAGTGWWAVSGSYGDVRSRGAVGNGVTDDRATLAAIHNGLPTGAGLRFPGPYTYLIGSNWTITRNVEFHPGAVLKPAAGVTITIGNPRQIRAGAYQIFDLSAGGAVVCSRGGPVLADWWGASPNDSTPSSVAITAALNANIQGMVVHLSAGIYRCDSPVTLPHTPEVFSGGVWTQDGGTRLLGSGRGTSTLKAATGYTGDLLVVGLPPPTQGMANYEIGHLNLHGNSTAARGLLLQRAGGSYIHHLTIQNCQTAVLAYGSSYFEWNNWFVRNNVNGVIIDNTQGSSLTALDAKNLRFKDNQGFSLAVDSDVAPTGQARGMRFQNCTFEAHNAVPLVISTHTGANNSATLIDTTKNFTTLGVRVGDLIRNSTDGSWGRVGSISTTTNPNDTITLAPALGAGTENLFDTGDTYTIRESVGVYLSITNGITLEDCWWEQTGVHLIVRGGEDSRHTRNIRVSNAHMAAQRISSPGNIHARICYWTGQGTSDGLSSGFENAYVTNGEFYFNTFYFTTLRDFHTNFQTTTLTGTFLRERMDRFANRPVFHLMESGEAADDSWLLRRYVQPHPSYTAFYEEYFVTGTTTSADPMVIFSLPTQGEDAIVMVAQGMGATPVGVGTSGHYVMATFQNDGGVFTQVGSPLHLVNGETAISSTPHTLLYDQKNVNNILVWAISGVNIQLIYTPSGFTNSRAMVMVTAMRKRENV